MESFVFIDVVVVVTEYFINVPLIICGIILVI